MQQVEQEPREEQALQPWFAAVAWAVAVVAAPVAAPVVAAPVAAPVAPVAVAAWAAPQAEHT